MGLLLGQVNKRWKGHTKGAARSFLLRAAPFSCDAVIVPQPLSMASFFEEAYAGSDADFLIRGVSDTSVDRPWQSSAHPLQLRR